MAWSPALWKPVCRVAHGREIGPWPDPFNPLVKKVKRAGHGFRNLTGYRLRLLLCCGIRWQTHRTARLRHRSPRFVAKSP
jgi:hypothetical protein